MKTSIQLLGLASLKKLKYNTIQIQYFYSTIVAWETQRVCLGKVRFTVRFPLQPYCSEMWGVSLFRIRGY